MSQINSEACEQLPVTSTGVCLSVREESDIRMDSGERTLLTQFGRIKYGSTYEDGPTITEG